LVTTRYNRFEAADFARVALLIAVLAFSVQANDRARRIIRERRQNLPEVVVSSVEKINN
jgi:hypothetical protein